ncbi:MAG: FkbM family methyltransferase [Fuerstiella sp.]
MPDCDNDSFPKVPAVDAAEMAPASLRRSLAALVTRRYPFLSGCGSFANSGVVQMLAGRHSGAAWCPTPGGQLLAPMEDYIGRAAYLVGDLDRKISTICRQIVRPGDVVLDVGANIGLVSLLLARLVGPTGRVHAFEPQPRLARMLAASLQKNGFQNTTLHEIALGDSVGKLQMHVPGHNAGAATLVNDRIRSDSGSLYVDVRTLDDVLAADQNSRIRLMKIDVEGYESQVIKGAQSIMRERRPEAVIFELNDGQKNFTQNEIVQLLRSYQYTFFAIPRCVTRMKLLPASDHAADGLGANDFLACATESIIAELGNWVSR